MTKENYEYLKLENQLCFPLYASSRLVTRMYQPLLEKMEITYPQYLILLVLWETGNLTVNQIGEKLLLETNTLTPLLKRMETKGILQRTRSKKDERKVIIELTKKGKEMKKEAVEVPLKLMNGLSDKLSLEKIIDLRNKLNELISAVK